MSRIETVSVLLADLVSSTMGNRLADDWPDELVREHVSLLRTAAADSGGREIKTTSEGLLAVFPTATAALQCAVAMQEASDQRNRSSEHELAIRIGVSFGESDPREGECYGSLSEEAARLCAAARAGEILLTDLVKAIDSGRSGLTMESVGELDRKGQWPLRASRVRFQPAADGVDSPSPLPPAFHGLPAGGYVGRGRELGVLRRLREEVGQGERRVALLSGEPGIGKTRLCAHAAFEMHRRGTTVLYGRCDQGIMVAYQPWVQSLGYFAQTGPEELLREHVADVGGELGRLLPELEQRLGELPPPRRTDPNVERYLLFRAVVEFLRRAARARPVVLILDDLHWADADALLLLRHVVAETSRERLLILAVYRGTEVAQNDHLLDALADLPRHRGVHRLELSGLEHSEVVELMQGEAGHELDTRGLALADEIFHETDGNPFFVGELLRHLRETGRVAAAPDGRWQITGSLAQTGRSAGVRELIDARIKRLAPELVSLLRLASVIGPRFDLELLTRVAGRDEDEVLDLLEMAVRAALVTETAHRPGHFAFAHALIAHTLYDDLGAARAARLHHRIAEALEVLATGELEPRSRLPELARHWAAAATAGNRDKAITRCHQAARWTLEQLAPDEAVRWFEQTLELQRSRIGIDDALSCDLLTGLGTAQRQAGQPMHRVRLLEAAGIASRLGDVDRLFEAAVANSRGLYSMLGTTDRERIAVLEDCLARLPPEDHGRRAVITALLASERSFDPDDRSRQELARQAIALARKSGDPFTLALTLGHTAVPLADLRTVELRRKHAHEVREIAVTLDDPSAHFWSDWIEQKAAIEAGDLTAGAAAISDMRSLADDIGQPTMKWLSGALQSALLTLHGSFEEAEQIARDAKEIGEGEDDSLPVFAAQLATIRWAQGRMDEVMDLLEQATARAPQVPAFALGAAMAYAESDQVDKARTIMRRWTAHDLAAIPWGTAWGLALAAVGVVVDVTRDRDVAAALHRRLLPWTHRFAHTHVACYGPLSLYAGMAAAVAGSYDDAETLLDHAAHENERVDAPFLLARTHLSWGGMLQERGAPGDQERAAEHLAVALDLAKDYGCAWVEKQATAVIAA